MNKLKKRKIAVAGIYRNFFASLDRYNEYIEPVGGAHKNKRGSPVSVVVLESNTMAEFVDFCPKNVLLFLSTYILNSQTYRKILYKSNGCL